MATPQSQILFTVAHYLRVERQSNERYLYLDGEIYAMAGESPQHATICMNLAVSVGTQLKGSRCQAWSKDFKVRSGPATQPDKTTRGLYSYPDLVVFCGAPAFLDEHRDVLLNPAVVIEVLSPSTEAFDRGEKFLRYQNWNPSLTDYLLISQTRPLVEHFIRQLDGSWSYHVYQAITDAVPIPAIDCTLSLVELYDRVEFPPEAEELPIEEENESPHGAK
ncbi:MAG: Uma2 family endonuclease [Blastocatellia bacterium]|nr:Uma2 family endonuclease [Blastocatellia bacterium]